MTYGITIVTSIFLMGMCKCFATTAVNREV